MMADHSYKCPLCGTWCGSWRARAWHLAEYHGWVLRLRDDGSGGVSTRPRLFTQDMAENEAAHVKATGDRASPNRREMWHHLEEP